MTGAATSSRASVDRPGMRARRLALMALFESEFGAASAGDALVRLGRERSVDPEIAEHADRIVTGVIAERGALDAEIARLAPAIPVSELGKVERAILRSAVWEVLYSAATPVGETINDAVSLARIYAGDAARRLVNGVLGSLRDQRVQETTA
jgi:N utilization substance protein B